MQRFYFSNGERHEKEGGTMMLLETQPSPRVNPVNKLRDMTAIIIEEAAKSETPFDAALGDVSWHAYESTPKNNIVGDFGIGVEIDFPQGYGTPNEYYAFEYGLPGTTFHIATFLPIKYDYNLRLQTLRLEDIRKQQNS